MTALFIGALLAATAPLPAAAQPPDDARRLFDEGVSLIDDQRYADAAAALERSRAIRETPPVLYNLGIAYRGLGAYRRAIAAFERFGELAGDNRRFAETRADVERILGELRAALVRLRVTIRGGATEVRIDGEAAPATDGTFEVVTDPGRHVIAASRPGHRPQQSVVEAANGQTLEVTIDAAAEPLPGELLVEVEPASAAILIDGAAAGSGRVERSVPPGRYEVQAEARGFVAQERAVEIAPGASQRVVITLAPVARRAEEPGVFGRWWFWTIVGVLVVGAGVTVAIAAQPGPQPIETGTLDFAVEALR